MSFVFCWYCRCFASCLVLLAAGRRPFSCFLRSKRPILPKNGRIGRFCASNRQLSVQCTTCKETNAEASEQRCICFGTKTQYKSEESYQQVLVNDQVGHFELSEERTSFTTWSAPRRTAAATEPRQALMRKYDPHAPRSTVWSYAIVLEGDDGESAYFVTLRRRARQRAPFRGPDTGGIPIRQKSWDYLTNVSIC